MDKKIVRLKNGETISYFEQGEGNKTLVLIHGNFSSSVYYIPLLERLPKDIKVLVPDLRGYGDSSYYRRISSLHELAEDIRLFLEAKNIKAANIVGWSLGGGVAMELAASHPELVTTLTLVNSTTHRGYPVFKKNEKGEQLVGEVYKDADEMGTDPIQVLPLLNAQKEKNFDLLSFIFEQTIYTVNKPSKEDNELYINESMKQVNLPDADWALATLNMSHKHNFYNAGTNTISNIKAPVLHTWGTKDITVPEYMVLENIKALEGQSKYIKYDNCGHSPFVDCPDQITADILEFIK